MEPLFRIVGAVAVFAVAVALYAVFVGDRGWLEALPDLDGERVLSEEDGVRVEQHGGPHPLVYPRCRLRVTDRRVVVAQKVLLSDEHALRYVLAYRGGGGGADLGASLRRACVIAEVAGDRIEVVETDRGQALAAPIGVPSLGTEQRVLVFASDARGLRSRMEEAAGGRGAPRT